MTRRTKPELDPDTASELIAEADASDRQRARLAIAGGVQAAQGQWIAAHLVAEALVLELLRVVESAGVDAPAYLRALAQAVERREDVH